MFLLHRHIGKKITVRAPGRINIIGEHTDYNGGLALPAATHLALMMEMESVRDPSWSIQALDPGEHFQLLLHTKNESSYHWVGFFRAMHSYAEEHQLPIGGLKIRFNSTIPIGAGMSSSSALTSALVAGMNHLFGWNKDPLSLIRIASRVEHGYGVQGGLLDQMSIFLSKENQALYLDFSNDSFHYLPMKTPGYSWVVWDSLERRQLVNSPYNQRRKAVENVLHYLHAPHWQAVSATEINNVKGISKEVRMMCHFILEENNRVRLAAKCLKEENIVGLGELLKASHAGLRDQYRVSSPGLDRLAGHLNSQKSCMGARMMGGGFGGMVLSLIKTQSLPELLYGIRQLPEFKRGSGRIHYPVHSGNGLTIEEQN